MFPLTALNGSIVYIDYCWGPWTFRKSFSIRKNMVSEW